MINISKSKLREKLLIHYFSRPDSELYVREAARAIDSDPSNLLRELNRLEQLGIFQSDTRGKQKYYKLNKRHPLYKELRNIVAKTVGIENQLLKIVEHFKEIRLSFIYGSYASEKEKADSDVDLFLIGKINIDLLAGEISELENRIGREINFRIYSENEFEKAVRDNNSFILNILKNKKVILKGDEKYIKKFIR